MELARWPKGLPTSPAHAQRAQRARLAAVGRALSSVLLLLGGLFLLAAVLYGVYSVLNTWLMNPDRYLRSPQLAALAVPAMTSTPTPTPTPTLPPTITPTPHPIPPQRHQHLRQPHRHQQWAGLPPRLGTGDHTPHCDPAQLRQRDSSGSRFHTA